MSAHRLSAAPARARSSTCSALSIAPRAGNVLIDGIDIGAARRRRARAPARREARLRFPVPLLASRVHRARERDAPDAPPRRASARARRSSKPAAVLGTIGPRRSGRASPAPALGRAAAARGHRARRRQRSADRPRRRADRQPRLEERRHRDGGLREARARAGAHHRDGHARAKLRVARLASDRRSATVASSTTSTSARARGRRSRPKHRAGDLGENGAAFGAVISARSGDEADLCRRSGRS